MKDFFYITILVHSEMEDGRNPKFKFESWQEAVGFMDVCLRNSFSVEVDRFEENEDARAPKS